LRILANENVAGSVIRALRERGHDVLSAKEKMCSAPDQAVFRRAQAKGRLILTNDKDFGELAFRSGLGAGSGIVLLRISGHNPETNRQRILAALETRSDWVGHLAVVTDREIRLRPLPACQKQ